MQVFRTLTWQTIGILFLGSVIIFAIFFGDNSKVRPPISASSEQESPTSTVSPTETFTPTNTATNTPESTSTPTATPSPTETPTLTPTPDNPLTNVGVVKQLASSEVVVPSFGNYLMIEKLGINSPITDREIFEKTTETTEGPKKHYEMDTPHGPEEVSSYDFSPFQGLDQQIVLAGHLDYANYGPAVFAKLKELAPGDVVQILTDGQISNFVVVSNTAVDMPFSVEGFVREAEAFEGLTLITCAGEFTSTSHYNQRQIVQAINID